MSTRHLQWFLAVSGQVGGRASTVAHRPWKWWSQQIPVAAGSSVVHLGRQTVRKFLTCKKTKTYVERAKTTNSRAFRRVTNINYNIHWESGKQIFSFHPFFLPSVLLSSHPSPPFFTLSGCIPIISKWAEVGACFPALAQPSCTHLHPGRRLALQEVLPSWEGSLGAATQFWGGRELRYADTRWARMLCRKDIK